MKVKPTDLAGYVKRKTSKSRITIGRYWLYYLQKPPVFAGLIDAHSREQYNSLMMSQETLARPLVLASASPRRRKLLGLLGLAFDARAARIEEKPHPGESPVTAMQRFAREKAAAVSIEIAVNGRSIVIGADTMVVLDGEMLGKPRDAAEAIRTLRRLRGREHQVYTALSILATPAAKPLECLARTLVPMRRYTDQEIDCYVRSGDPLDKAGAYAIQNTSFRPVTKLTGCYANVMGFPLCHLTRQLRKLDIEPPADIPTACQRRLDYTCPVYGRVLTSPPCGTCLAGQRPAY